MTSTELEKLLTVGQESHLNGSEKALCFQKNQRNIKVKADGNLVSYCLIEFKISTSALCAQNFLSDFTRLCQWKKMQQKKKKRMKQKLSVMSFFTLLKIRIVYFT
jgi:hypothetical protein